jgi:DNA invertase Pin-like site-specific DNA recombinase
MLNMLAVIAQFEREIMLERQKEGVQRAKAEGKYKGRTPTARVHTAENCPAGQGRHETRGSCAAAQHWDRQRVSLAGGSP